MANRYVFGFLGPRCTANARKTWNAFLREQGIDGCFDFYRTLHAGELSLRFSEMFLLERRGYLIDPSLQASCMELMDVLTPRARQQKRVDIVINRRGVLIGDCCGSAGYAQILRLWMDGA